MWLEGGYEGKWYPRRTVCSRKGTGKKIEAGHARRADAPRLPRTLAAHDGDLRERHGVVSEDRERVLQLVHHRDKLGRGEERRNA